MLDFGSSCNKADKRPHVITAVAQRTKTSHRHAQITWDDTALQPGAMCHSASLSLCVCVLKEYIQSEFLNDSGDRPFLFISGLCIFNVSRLETLSTLINHTTGAKMLIDEN